MKRVLLSFGMAVTLLLLGCARDPVDPNKLRDQETYNRLKSIFQLIRGEYRGTLVSNSGQRTEDAILNLDYSDKDTGRKNVDGQTVYQPVPTGKFVLPSTNNLDAVMEGAYDEISGLITLKTFDGPIFKIQGSLINQKFIGQLYNSGDRLVGNLLLDHFTPDSGVPPNSEQEQYTRLKCRLNRVVGRYVMTMTPLNTKDKPFKFDLTISTMDITTDKGVKIPTLFGRGRRTDGYSTTGEYIIIYRDDIIPEHLSISSTPNSVGYSKLTMDANIFIDPKTGDTTFESENATSATFGVRVKAKRDPSSAPKPCRP